MLNSQFLTRSAAVLALSAFAGVLAYSQDAADAMSQVTSDATTTGSIINGYFPEWGPGTSLNGFLVKNLVTSGAAAKLTYITFAFGTVSTNGTCGLSSASDDITTAYPAAKAVSGVADSTSTAALKGIFHQFQELKAKYPNLKIIASIGGSGGSGNFSDAVATSTTRSNFVTSCTNLFIDGKFGLTTAYPGIFDGIDIDWEYPASAADQANLTLLLEAFHNSFGSEHVLTAATPAGSWNYTYMNLQAMSQWVNFLNVMTYDYDGPWSTETGLVAPLYMPNGDISVDQTIQAYKGLSVPASKILMGVPYYAYRWTSVPSADYGLDQTGTPEPTGSTAPSYNYAYVAALSGYSSGLHRDATSGAPWVYTGSTFYTFDDPTSAGCKAHYVKHYGLAGIMTWDLSGDTSNAALTSSISSGLAATTNTGCPAFSDSETYNFESSTQGWAAYVGKGNVSGISTVTTSSTEFFEGSKSLAVTFNPNNYTSSPQVYVASPSVAPGSTVQFEVWIPAGSTVIGLEPFVEDQNWTWTSNYVSTLYGGAWNTVTVTVPSTAVTPLQEIGIQFALSGATSATVYIDSVGPQ